MFYVAMPTILENITVRQRAVVLAKTVRKVCKENPSLVKDYGMRDQIQRAATSIASNIAEGNDRETNKEFIRYLVIARGSCSELKTQISIIEDDLDGKLFYILINEIIEIHKMINGFIKAIKP
jgi:four helix bundle protein